MLLLLLFWLLLAAVAVAVVRALLLTQMLLLLAHTDAVLCPCCIRQAEGFVSGLFQLQLDINTFKQHLRDFLISIKEFTPEDSADLFYAETQVLLASAALASGA